jgi:PAS domain S-box-containing protein
MTRPPSRSSAGEPDLPPWQSPEPADPPFAFTDRHLEEVVRAVTDYAIFLLDAEGRVVNWNAGAERIEGYAKPEVLGRHFSLFYTEEAKAEGWPDRELHLATAEGRFEDEGWRVRKDGSRFWASVVLTPLFEQGHLRGFLKITRDLTERREAEERLRRSEERTRLLIESVADYAIFMLDPDGRVATWNTGAERIKGYTADEIIGTHFSRFYPEEALRADWPAYELEVAAAAGRFEDEGWRVRKDGTRFWANVVISAVRDEQGTLRGFSKVTRDLTERRMAEERLRAAYAALEERVEARTAELARTNAALQEAVVRLEEADRNKDRFLAILAHELRNPLAPIRNATELLQTMRRDDPEIGQVSGIIERQARQLTRLVDDLLDVSRITGDRLQLQRETTDLEGVVRVAVDTSRPLIDANGHTLEVTLPPASFRLEADPARLAQIFANLLNNAARFTPPGGRISLVAERRATSVVVRVRDTGIGIPAEGLRRIFEMFTQLDAGLERSRDGLGIGLTLAKRLAELHGGSLTVASEGPGRGSEFTVTLPIGDAAPAERAGSEHRPADAPARRRVLVVDDNRDSAESLAMLLSIGGDEVRAGFDGYEAIRVAAQWRPDVVLLDIGMPGLSGYDVARRLRANPWGRDVVLVAMTGWGAENDKRRARDAGFDHHLTKPIDPAEVRRILAELRRRGP